MDFWGDRRGQPVQIGFVLLFGILVLAFASYQGYVVPNQNAQVEFQHFQTVDNQFTDFRTNLVNAVDSDADRSTSFTLGTQYPSRLIALNPPPVSGNIRTTDPGAVTVETNTADVTSTVCGSDNATTRSLVYTPKYNEYQNAKRISLENSVITREFSEANVHDEQRLVRPQPNGPDHIELLLLNGSVSKDGVNAYAVDISASGRRSTTIKDPNVTVPSRFDVSDWEHEILEGVSGVNGVSSPSPGSIRIDFGGTFRVSCAVAGLNSEPAFGPGEGGDGGINPSAPGNIRLNGARTIDTGSNEVELAFQNLGSGNVNVTQARINFYQGNQLPDEAVISASRSGDSGTLEIGGYFVTLDPKITLPGDSESTIWFDFDKNVQKDDWFVLTLQFENGETGQYFISLRDENDGSGVGGGGTGSQPTVRQLTANKSGDDVNVNYNVEDIDGDLVEIRLVLERSNGDDLNSQTMYNGPETNQESGDYVFQNVGSQARQVRLIATDTEGNTVESVDGF